MRVLFLGLGGVGQRHLRNLRSLHPDCEVAAVRSKGRSFEISNDLKADDGVDIMRKYDVRHLANVNEALAFKPDFAVVANPSSLHVDACLPLLTAGIGVLLEKPAATTPEDFSRLETCAAATGAPLMIAYQLRWHPCVQRLKEILDQGLLGRLHSAEVSVQSHMPSWHNYERPDQFYAGVAALGGGVVMTEIHELDLLGWFFGMPRKVFAVGGRASDLDLDVEDTLTACMLYEIDKAPLPASLCMSFIQTPPSRRFAVHGEKGTAILEIPKLRLVVLGPDGKEIEVFDKTGFDRNQMFLDELSHFIDCAINKQQPLTSLASIRAGQMTAFALKTALQTGKPISP